MARVVRLVLCVGLVAGACLVSGHVTRAAVLREAALPVTGCQNISYKEPLPKKPLPATLPAQLPASLAGSLRWYAVWLYGEKDPFAVLGPRTESCTISVGGDGGAYLTVGRNPSNVEKGTVNIVINPGGGGNLVSFLCPYFKQTSRYGAKGCGQGKPAGERRIHLDSETIAFRDNPHVSNVDFPVTAGSLPTYGIILFQTANGITCSLPVAQRSTCETVLANELLRLPRNMNAPQQVAKLAAVPWFRS